MADVLWLDSSVLRQLKRSQLRDLADLAKKKGVPIVVHAHIHLEYCRYLRGSMRARGLEFTPSVISTSLGQLGITVAQAMLDRDAAEAWAALLSERYVDDDAWQDAKLEAVKARLPEGTRLRPGDVPMTTDWLVALEVERQSDLVAVQDKGPEWKSLRDARRALSYVEATRSLESCADPVPRPSSA